MPLTSTVTLFLNLDFLYIFSAFPTLQAKYPSVQKVCSFQNCFRKYWGYLFHIWYVVQLFIRFTILIIDIVGYVSIIQWMWSLSVSIYLIITLCLWHISYENCFISSDICLETSNFFLYLQTKIMWYCNRYLCLFLDFHVPMPWVYNNFWFLATLTHRLKPVGLR